MSNADTHSHGSQLPIQPERATLEGKNKVLGFWLFLAAEAVLFGTLFAAFLTLRNEVADGLSGVELFHLPITALATFILLTSSLTSVMAIQAMHRVQVKKMQMWLYITVALGLSFLCIEIYEFNDYVVNQDFGMSTSAFSSSFYTLVGFHGAHVLFGIIWITLITAQVSRKGLTVVSAPKIYIAALYWHFVDVVWLFVFTVVYLMGKVG